jgi:hypothetical protein
MRLTTSWALLIAYMTLSGMMLGFFSPWAWLGLLAAVAARLYCRPAPAVAAAWQGPHFARARHTACRREPVAK